METCGQLSNPNYAHSKRTGYKKIVPNFLLFLHVAQFVLTMSAHVTYPLFLLFI